MIRFAKSVKEWLKADPENVIVVHCKGGKGKNTDLYFQITTGMDRSYFSSFIMNLFHNFLNDFSLAV